MATDPYGQYCRELATACVTLGLAVAARDRPSQVLVWDRDFEAYAEVIACKIGPEGVPHYWWSHGGLAGPAGCRQWAREVARVAVRVVSPRLQGLAGRAVLR